MDHPSYCAGSCKNPAVQTASGVWLCTGCGLSLEVRKARQRKVVKPYTRPVGQLGSIRRHPVSGARRVLAEPVRAAKPAPEVQTVPCSTCSTGRIGVARWDDGIRSCTACEPLTLVAIQMHKGAEDFHLDVSPEQAKSTRRRP